MLPVSRTPLDWFGSVHVSLTDVLIYQGITVSDASNLSCGVPQGSILGPFLVSYLLCTVDVDSMWIHGGIK